MKYVKTQKEFQEMKQNITKKLDDFIQEYDEFTRCTSPVGWRTTGHHFSELRKIKRDLTDDRGIKPLTMKDLESEIVRDQLLTDEEKELWNVTKSYNL